MVLSTSPRQLSEIFEPQAEALRPLIIFELANNHLGNLAHGLRMVDAFSDVAKEFTFNVAFKLQLRHIPTFIHPDYRQRMDIPYVKRFSETQFDELQLRSMCDAIQSKGHLTMCTPFDENSVHLIEKVGFDILKIGSCSCTDWPFLERISRSDMPMIISTGGAQLSEIDVVVTHLRQGQKRFAIMHCVGEYPTPIEDLQLNQIDLLRSRYPDLPVGYSTHEPAGDFDAMQMAIAKGAMLFERHVALPADGFPVNAYSTTPEQCHDWLSAIREALVKCGLPGGRAPFSAKERADLRGFQRGVFASRDLQPGEQIDSTNVFYAWPNIEGQLIANDLAPGTKFTVQIGLAKHAPVLHQGVQRSA